METASEGIVAGKISALIVLAGALAALGGVSIAAKDKNTVQVPNGLGFADFKGYESWEVVSVAAVDPTEVMGGDSDAVLNVIMANPTMIEAYKKGIPSNGTKFPDGSKIAKIQWKTKMSGLRQTSALTVMPSW